MSGYQTEREGVSRRSVLLGLGAAAGAAAAVTALPAKASAAAGVAPAFLPSVPQAVDAPISGLTYIGLDAQQFFPSGDPSNRLYEDLTGSKVSGSGTLFAGIPLPAGSVLYQVNVGYQQQPILFIHKRSLQQPAMDAQPEQVFFASLQPSPGGPFSSTVNLPTPIVIDRESTYTISFFVSAGSAIFGCTLGYQPPTQSFVPFSGSEPRVLDTRLPGPLTGMLAPNQEKVVPLGFAGARSAVLNLTITQSGTGGGFVAVFAAGIAWPGNSSINWTAGGQTVANGVITAADSNGNIKIRGGGSPTHVIIDRIGFMI
jgi:hypothetical protein